MPRISRDADVYPITMRELEVLRVEDVTPGMRRVVFGGAGLLPHTRDGEDIPGIVSDGFDDDMRIIFPHPVTGDRPYPPSLGDGRLDWNAEVNELFRTYTVRSWRPEVGEFGELTVDFARHGAGLAEGWSASAAPGDKLYAAGPKNCASLPVHTDWLVLVGDETALPAMGRCIEEVPEGHPVTAVIEVADRADIQDDLSQAACASTLDLRWVVRAEGGDFTEEILTIDLAGEQETKGTPFVWAAGESGRLKKVRKWVKEAAVPREHVQVSGYWRLAPAAGASTGEGTGAEGAGAGADGAAPAAPAAPSSSMSPLMALHEMSEITPGLALMTAANLGIFEAVDSAAEDSGAEGAEGAAPVGAVAEAVSVDKDLLVRFLRFLETLDLVELVVSEGEGAEGGVTAVRLTMLGGELADPDGLISRMAGPSAVKVLSWLHLEEGLRTGRPVNIGATGQDWTGLRASDPRIAEDLSDGEATRAQWVAPALATGFDQLTELVGAVSTVAVAGAAEGTAAAVYADELLRHDESLRTVVLDLDGRHGSDPERLIKEVGAGRRDRCEVQTWTPGTDSGASAEVVILIDPFSTVPTSELPGLLAAAGRVGKAVVVVSQLLAESGDDDHDYEEDLTRLLLNGGAVPTKRDLSRAIAGAGLRGVGSRAVGWGSHAVVAVAS
ncbi:MAG TPA: siderophore-interacting protein [Candidatus Corynebacterium avicola]|uniref:Siderophore-interacting protein n=1 Tax=Candidatus Corynebacterium avicola TaxID=2838527 RepID=A0A9D1RPD1_9CORY|nr:siderophore-interacting protein [Candidatus Corynebacterium avicola]